MREELSDKKRALLIKLKTLAERGVGGESENAQCMLRNLLWKYDLSESDLESEHISEHYTHVDTKQPFDERLLCQICYSVYGDINPDKKILVYTHDSKSRRWKRIIIKCTDAEFLEIMAKYEHYYNHLHEDLKTFYSAFISVNEIYPPENLRTPDKKPRGMTDKDWEAAKLASSMKKRDFLKRLTSGNFDED